MNRVHQTLRVCALFALVVCAICAAPVVCAADAPMKAARNIPYLAQGGDPKLNALDIYAPAGAANLPVVIFIHGGGWRDGDKVMGAGDKASDFTRQGNVFVSINYRLVPAVQYPVFVQDCAQAVAWVHNHIRDYGGDPDKLFVMGHSAGAHLAALISTDPQYLTAAGTSLKVLRGCILLDSAGYDLRRGAPADLITRGIYRDAFGTDPAVRASASPLLHVAAGQDIPPFLIFYVSTRNTSRRQSESMAAALTAAHVSADIKPAYNKSHRTLNVGLGTEGDIPTQQVMEFLDKYK